MTTKPTTTEQNEDPAPVACTLTAAGLAAQSDRWERLATRAMTGRAETAHGLRLFFRAEPGADRGVEPGVEEELRALVAVENECCPWADWTVETNDEQIVLNVHSIAAGITTLHSTFTNLRPSGPATRTRATRRPSRSDEPD